MATIINPITTVLLNRDEFVSGEFERFPFKYILEDDGTISYFSKLSGGRFILSHEAQIPGLGRAKTNKAPVAEIQPLAHGHKLPGEMFKQVRQFFLDVMDMGPGTYEAQIFIVWNETSQDYRIVVPKQTVSAAAVKYDIGELLGEDDVIICDIHSHNNMGAFFSGTDDKDDKKNPWISGVFGKLSTTMENKFRFNDGCGRHFPMKAEDVFDFGENIATPSEWLAQVELSSYSPAKVSGIRSWNQAFGHANSQGRGTDEWSAPNNGKLEPADYSWMDMFDPEGDLYDAIVDTLNDADNIESKAVLEALKERLKNPAHIPELSERESHMFVEIDYTITQAKDDTLADKVLDQLIAVY